MLKKFFVYAFVALATSGCGLDIFDPTMGPKQKLIINNCVDTYALIQEGKGRMLGTAHVGNALPIPVIGGPGEEMYLVASFYYKPTGIFLGTSNETVRVPTKHYSSDNSSGRTKSYEQLPPWVMNSIDSPTNRSYECDEGMTTED